MRFRTRFAAAVMLMAVVGLLFSLVSPTPVRGAGSAPVTVMNTAVQPVPVALQGTGSVAGTVNAAQSGTWMVGVSSLPAVQLAAGSNVVVADVDHPARHALVIDLCNGGSCNADPVSTTLPVGKRYVIEQVSGRCEVSSGGIDGARLGAWVNGDLHLYAFRDQISAPDFETTIGYFFQETRIYADGGVPDGLYVEYLPRGAVSATTYCRVTLSGYLVDASPIFPAQP